MIIYMYLTIIVVFSILTGIITTIIEKKGLHANTRSQTVPVTSVPNSIVRPAIQPDIPEIPKVEPATNLTHTMEILNLEEEFSPGPSDFNEAKILSIIDEEIL